MKKMLALLTVALLPAAAAAQNVVTPDALVKSVTQDVVELISKDQEIKSGSRAKLVSVIEEKVLPHFNFTAMTALAMGQNWGKASPEQKKQLTEAFKTLLVRTYASALSAYSNQKFDFRPLRAKPTDTDVTVNVRVMQSGTQPVQIDYDGESRELKRSAGGLFLTFGFAILIVYLVLAAQFESFIDPLIIMLSVPLSMLGALLALKLSGGTLNVFSQIGLITLVGLITKHGILIVEFANQLREQGLGIFEAVKQSAALRLRPILMTTGAMVLGSVPLAVASGAGAESRQQIGWVIVGGLLFGTLLTLFVVPVVYTLIARTHRPIETAA